MTTQIRMLLPLGLAALLATACDSKGSGDDTANVGDTVVDADGDGFNADEDCNDDDSAVNPGASEICDGIDNNCDGAIDEGVMSTFYADSDGDGFGDEAVTMDACAAPSGYVNNANDCDDNEANAFPGNAEVCDGIDNDCDGDVDGGATDAQTWYADVDGDGYGDATTGVEACDQPTGAVLDDTDCDDTNVDTYPGADEYCNGIDDNCDGDIDEDAAVDVATWYADSDEDGFGDPAVSDIACDQPTGYVENDADCDDTEPTTKPTGIEVCDGADNNCDGDIDEDTAVDASTWYIDSDSDGYGDHATSTKSCYQPTGYVSDFTDCDDAASSTYPGADEYCNSTDDDCDGDIDEDAVDGGYYATDDDGDGFGASGSTVWTCDGVDNEFDCDDTDATEPIVVNGTTGSSSGDGSAASPLDTIQSGIDTATQCVAVYAGTYAEAIDFGGRDIAVTGVEGLETTIIDASGLGEPVVTFAGGETSAATLSGFTLQGGEGYLEESSESTACTSIKTCTTYYSTYCGGGVYVSASDPTLDDLLITGNELAEASTTTSGDDTYVTYSYGGGVCVVDGVVAMTGVDLYSNFADQGGGAYVDETSVVTYEQGWVVDNTATDGAGWQIDGGTVTFTNLASMWNDATGDGGGILAADSTVTATNITLTGDDAPSGGGLYLSGSAVGAIDNSIIANAGTGEGVLADSGATFAGTYNDVTGNAGGEYSGTTDPTGTSGNISTDPTFTAWSDDGDYTNDDIALTTGSACMDSGNPAYTDADGSASDMGAFGGTNSDWND